MSSPFHRRSTPVLGALAAVAVLSACNGSSGSDPSPALTAQAVDGYLVGSSVFCDDVENGGTAAAGRFTCPAGTELFRIVGGADVGLDETRTSGGMPFIGELKSPSSLSWVTPLSTIAVELSSSADGEFDPGRFARSVDSLASALGESDLDLDADASRTTQLLRLNAQINQVLSSFVDTDEDYTATGRVFASLVAEAAADGSTYSLTDGVDELLTRLNTRLADTGSTLTMDNAALGQAISRVQSANIAIANAERPDMVPSAVESATPPAPVLTIDRDVSFVGIGTVGEVADTEISLEDFESDELSRETAGFPGRHAALVTDQTDHVYIGHDAFDVERALSAKTISLGFELVATRDGDRRRIALTTAEAKLTTDPRGDAMTLTLPAGSELNVQSVDADGTRTESLITLESAHEFSSENEGIEISFWRIDARLEEEGFGDIVASDGDYRLTAVIGGVRIGESNNGVVAPATQRTVSTADQIVTGSGFVGHVTFLRFER